MKLRFFVISIVVILISCSEKKSQKIITAAAYHWKSSYKPTEALLQKIDQAHICKQYIRFFDIDLDQESGSPIPKSLIRFKKRPQSEIVPVIYITNRTFKDANILLPKDLAKKAAKKINEIAENNAIDFRAVQIDCDWTKSTAKAYFDFLEEFKRGFSNDIQFSVTLRLHQIKFKEQTGVPPVSRGTLMLYNMGDWTNIETPNSLFDPQIIDQYIHRIPEYPLALDIALPIYTQIIVYRNNQFFTYLKNASIKDLQKEFDLKKGDKTNQYICTIDKEYRSKSFRKGDIFRAEKASYANLLKVKKAMKQRITNKEMEIILYHLDEKSFENFSLRQIRQLVKN